jgi:hemolysin III
LPSPTTFEPKPAEPPVARVKPLLRGWLHLGAFFVTLIAGPILISEAPSPGTTAALSVYVLSVLALFGVSAAFHRKNWSPRARRRMRRADHATIFVAIAGTYTAVSVLALEGWARVVILLVVWIGAVGGIALRQLWLDAPKWAVAVPYVVVGWSALAVLPQLVHGLGGVGFTLLVLGGAFYTAGAIVYALRKPDPWPGVFGYHEVFHACTIAGATLHFAVIAAYALPRA